jgi:MFS family permease
VAILLLVLERTGDAGLGGLLVAALMVPHVVAAPVIGAIADRARRRRLLYLGAFAGFGAALIGSVALIGRQTWPSVAVLVVGGCFGPLLTGGLTSLLGELAGDRLERAFGLDATTYSLAGIAGPALAAVLTGLTGAAWSLVALGALAVVGGLLVCTLPLPAPTERGPRPGFRATFGALGVMWRRRPLAAVTAGTMLNMAGVGAFPVVAALLAVEADSAELTGLILSAGAVGGLAGSLLITRWPIRRWPPERVLVVCLAGMAVLLLVAAPLPAGWFGLPVFALAGVLGAPQIVATFAVRDRESPPGMRTQIFALGGGLKVTSAAAGAAVAGLAVPAGPALLIAGMAACQVLGVVAVLLIGRVPAPSSIVSQAN